MATPPRLVAFDLDDTLAPSKSAIDPRMGDLLVALAARVEVAIISGGQLAQFTMQVVDRLPEASADTLARLHLLPTCGTQYYRLSTDGIDTIYAHSLADDEKQRAITAVEEEAKRLGLWESETWGEILEDRGSQITFSALGQQAPVDAKMAWDPTGEKRTGSAKQLPLACQTSRCARADRHPSISPRAESIRPTGCVSSPIRPASRSTTCSSSVTVSTRTATTTPCSPWASPARLSRAGKTPPSSSRRSSREG